MRLGAPIKWVESRRENAAATIHGRDQIGNYKMAVKSDGTIAIGAMATHYAIESSSVLWDRCPLLSETAAQIGDVQIRNRETIGGNLAHADPAADWPATPRSVVYEKTEQKASGFALARVAVVVPRAGDLRIGVTGVTAKAYRADTAERALYGRPASSPEVIARGPPRWWVEPSRRWATSTRRPSSASTSPRSTRGGR